MSLYLRYTTGSPFARTVRVVLAEKGLDFEGVEEVTTTSAEARAQDAPTLQVPAFRDGDLVLWDSLVIVEHLMATYPNAAPVEGHVPFADTLLRTGRELPDRLQLATLATLGTSIATVSQLKWSGQGLENAFAARQAERMDYILDWAEAEIASDDEGFVPGVASVQDVMLTAWLAFADARPIGLTWASPARPKIAALVERLSARPSLQSAPIWWWEPGVTGYESDGTPVFG